MARDIAAPPTGTPLRRSAVDADPDPNLDSCYVMDALVVQLPKALRAAAQPAAADLTAAAAQRPSRWRPKPPRW